MVKRLTTQDHELLHAAIRQAAHKTSAHIHVAVLQASDSYHDYVLFYGIALGSVIALTAWSIGLISDFPPLLTIILGVGLLFDLVPWLRFLCLAFIPRAVKHHRAARAAINDFHGFQAHIAQGEPFILLFVSVGERYVHVVTNAVVHAKLPDHWQQVTDRFAVTLRQKDLVTACTQAVDQIAGVVGAAFPPAS